jgi:flavin reductase (DIM6/NTAB) family NADH-FMN oxidoreductase RutF
MARFIEQSPEQWQQSVFKRVGTDWMLVGAKNGDGANMMTASWGGMGILWGRPVAFVFLRPQRFTRELVDAAGTFSLTFYDEKYREQLNLCGSKSGRDVDKVQACGFDIVYEGETPYFAQANTAIICRKLYRQPLLSACFTDSRVDEAMYPQKDYHILYVGEVSKLLVRG